MKSQKQRIFLIGPMGSGKTSIGKALALMMEKPFVDLDDLIVQQAGMSIPDIFAREQEAGFRRRESEVVKSSLKYEAVIATGGGVVVTPENLPVLAENGVVVYLRPDVETQYQRTRKDNNRPMIFTDDRYTRLKEIFAYRDPLYTSIADITVDSGKNSIHDCVETIIAAIREE